jgi:hypothetical protein
MNKSIVPILVACGLFVLNSPEAAAHPEADAVHRPPLHDRAHKHYRDDHDRRDHRRVIQYRTSHMPRWLKEDRSFRHWYRHTRLQRNPYLSWYALFDIYCIENSRPRRYRH